MGSLPIPRVRGLPLLPFAAASLAVSLLDCGKAERPIGTVMMFLESAYRDVEEGRGAIAEKAGTPAPSLDGEFNRIGDRARRIVELTDEPRYAKHTSDPEFQAWRLELKREAFGMAEAAGRRDAPGVERGCAEVTRILSACHRKYPTNPRQPGR